MKKKNKTESDDAAVDMTPMLDIVFIMLIFFIVSSTFLHETGISMTEHRKNENPEPENKSAKAIILRICSNQQIFIDQRVIDVRSVRANVERKLAEDSRSVVIIEAEKEASTGVLVMVMDQARSAKANISVAPMVLPCNANQLATLD